jgi:hypothetical protein
MHFSAYLYFSAYLLGPTKKDDFKDGSGNFSFFREDLTMQRHYPEKTGAELRESVHPILIKKG